jgi:hypothetical protein
MKWSTVHVAGAGWGIRSGVSLLSSRVAPAGALSFGTQPARHGHLSVVNAITCESDK